jgi:fatty acid desaturase
MVSSTVAIVPPINADDTSVRGSALDDVTHRLVADLHTPRPLIYWTDLLASALIGWAAFGAAVAARPLSATTLIACIVAALAFYRGLCFTHEITHLRRRALPGFETAWNLLFGLPLLLPTFTYNGVHQSHHNMSSYGTSADPEYLPFAKSRALIWGFAIHASLLSPLFLLVRFLVLAPIGLLWPRFHRWLETHASSFVMNPAYRRQVTPAVARQMRRWEAAILMVWAALLIVCSINLVPWRMIGLWYVVLVFVSLFNTLRVLGAHAYDSHGTPLDRHGQLKDSIDTPGGPWTELWAPVGLRYHALHHYYPGIPYHNLGTAYRRILAVVPSDSLYRQSTSPSLRESVMALYEKARRAGLALLSR